jgi:hypothetical protein
MQCNADAHLANIKISMLSDAAQMLGGISKNATRRVMLTPHNAVLGENQGKKLEETRDGMRPQRVVHCAFGRTGWGHAMRVEYQ